MSLPYRFVSLNDEQNQRRRQLLDGYGHFAQLSILLVPLIYQLGLGVHLLFGRLYRLRDYKPVKDHQSPVVSRFKQPSAANSRLSLRRLCWALDEEVASGWGTRKEWLIAIWWGAWLFVLAVKETGNGTYTGKCLLVQVFFVCKAETHGYISLHLFCRAVIWPLSGVFPYSCRSNVKKLKPVMHMLTGFAFARLSTRYPTIWNRCGLPTPHPLPPGPQKLVPNPISHPSLPRRTELLPPRPRPPNPRLLRHSCHTVPEFLRPILSSSEKNRRPRRYPRPHSHQHISAPLHHRPLKTPRI